MVINGKRLLDAKPIKNMLPHKVYENGVSHGLSEAGYDIRIRQEVNFTRDLFIRRSVELVSHPVDEPFDELTPPVIVRTRGKFVLASSMEEFQMPLWLMGEVKDKSSWARQGLSVFNTVIEPGWKGFLTLELVYHHWKDLHIPAGAGIAQVIFSQVREPTEYTGRYQYQPNRPTPAIKSALMV